MKTFIAILALHLIGANLNAQNSAHLPPSTVENGLRPTGDSGLRGTPVVDPFWGISFQVPEDWIHQQVDGGYLLASQQEQGIILLTAHQYDTIEDLRTASSQILDDGQGTRLIPAGAAQSFTAAGLALDYSGTFQDNPVRGRAIGLVSPYGGGVTLIAMAEPAVYSDVLAGRVESTALSVKFTPPAAAPEIEKFQRQLSGARLTFVSSYSSGLSGGISSQRVISLCGDGRFSLNGSSLVSIDVGGAFGNSGDVEQGEGVWRIENVAGKPMLQLDFSDGSAQQYLLTTEADQLFLNGSRYFLTYDPECR